MILSISSIQAATLESIRYNRFNNKVQLVLDIDEKIAFQQFSLANPPRIVLDFPNTRHRNLKNININQGVVNTIRVGYRSENMLRIVVDLKTVTRANIYVLPSVNNRKYRIVLDIYHPDSAEFIQLTSVESMMPQVFDNGELSKDDKTYLSKSAIPKIAKQNQQKVLKRDITIDPPPKLTITAEPMQSSVIKPVQNILKPISSSSLPVDMKKNIDLSEGKKNPKRTEISPRKRTIMVCIDPGHGGKDPGAYSKATGAREKNVVLAIAKRLRDKLLKKKGYRVIMTRKSDVFVPLYQRPKNCRQSGGDLFVSIHADAVESSEPRGSSIYILSTRGASSQLAKYLAKTENAVDLKWGVDVNRYDNDIQKALLNIQQEVTLESSYVLAIKTLEELGQIGNIHKSTVERANFVVLRAPEIPSMLVETAFISNPNEARLLTQPNYQEKLAIGIANGIEHYFLEHLPQ